MDIIYIHIRLSCFLATLMALVDMSSISAQDTLIQNGAEWYYLEYGSPTENWMNYRLSETEWKSGISPLGYGDTLISTIIPIGEDSLKKDLTKYFRKTINLEDPFEYFYYQLAVQRDDGIVLYLNGREVWRNNMPEGRITHQSLATNLVWSTETERNYLNKTLTPDMFNPGLNTISASIHQARASSSDILFNLELYGIKDPNLLPSLLKEQNSKQNELSGEIRELTYKLEIEKNISELRLSQRNNFLLNSSLFLLGLALFITSILSYLFYKKNKDEKSTLLTSIEAKDKKLQELSNKMLSSSLSAINDNNFLKDVKTELQQSLSLENGQKKAALNKLISNIDNNLTQEEDWDNFKGHFNTTNSGFVDTLFKLYPTLSEVEIRHCIFIKLHMQTKEIGRILNIDPRSVQSSRYRIKKKMKLDGNTDLKTYLHEL